MSQKKLKCIHRGCNNAVIMRCMECGAPVCELHSVHGRFCSDDCYRYGRRKLEKKKSVMSKRNRIAELKKNASIAITLLMVLIAIMAIAPHVISAVPGEVDRWTEEWVGLNFTNVTGVLATTDEASIFPCSKRMWELPTLTPGSATFMPNNEDMVMVIGIPPYNMDLFDKQDFCMRIEIDDDNANYTDVVIRGEFKKITEKGLLESIAKELKQRTRLTESELGFMIQSNGNTHTGIYHVTPLNTTAKINKHNGN